jgi:hypothetical protein
MSFVKRKKKEEREKEEKRKEKYFPFIYPSSMLLG